MALSWAGLAYEELALADHPEAVDRLRLAGHMLAQVVVDGDRVWSGFRADMS